MSYLRLRNPKTIPCGAISFRLNNDVFHGICTTEKRNPHAFVYCNVKCYFAKYVVLYERAVFVWVYSITVVAKSN